MPLPEIMITMCSLWYDNFNITCEEKGAKNMLLVWPTKSGLNVQKFRLLFFVEAKHQSTS